MRCINRLQIQLFNFSEIITVFRRSYRYKLKCFWIRHVTISQRTVLGVLSAREWSAPSATKALLQTSESFSVIINWCRKWGFKTWGGWRKSGDIWGKRLVSSVFWISQVLFGPSERGGRKDRKRAKKAYFGRFPGREARHPLNPHFLHPSGTPNYPIPSSRNKWWADHPTLTLSALLA